MASLISGNTLSPEQAL